MPVTKKNRTAYIAETDLSEKWGYFVMAGAEPQHVVLSDGSKAPIGVIVDVGSYGVGDHLAVADGTDDEPDVFAAEDLVFGDVVGSDADGKASKAASIPAGSVVRGAKTGELVTVRLFAPKAKE